MHRTRPYRWSGWKWWPGAGRRTEQELLAAAEEAIGLGWPVVPGALAAGSAALRAGSPPCSCGAADCPVPGAHPHDPPLDAATTDARMVRWWWQRRSPGAPVVVATGSRVCAVSLPAEAGARMLRHCAAAGVAYGPVLAAGERYVLLVAPYTLDELGGLLADRGWVPGSLRYHGPGGYLVLPPARTWEGQLSWVRSPSCADELPQVATLLGWLVAAAESGESDRWRRGMHQRSDLFKE